MLLLQALQIRTPIMSQPQKNMRPSVMKVQALFSDSVCSVSDVLIPEFQRLFD